MKKQHFSICCEVEPVGNIEPITTNFELVGAVEPVGQVEPIGAEFAPIACEFEPITADEIQAAIKDFETIGEGVEL